MSLTLTTADWLALFTHFMSLSLLSIGGAITTAPLLQRCAPQGLGYPGSGGAGHGMKPYGFDA